MKKQFLTIILLYFMIISFSCKTNGTDQRKEHINVGMVTTGGTIDDNFHNEITWNGILKISEQYNIIPFYKKPIYSDEKYYLKEIDALIDLGCKIIVTPSFKFNTTIYKCQSKYEDTKFIMIDGRPHSEDYITSVTNNTVSVYFEDKESGFIAGIAAALQLKDASVGFLGGMDVPFASLYAWGFKQGLLYANSNLGTRITLNQDNFIYQGTFHDVIRGQEIASKMFDNGVEAIFCVAGGGNLGAIDEAAKRRVSGEKVWIIGSDYDQYNDGIYDQNKSVVLTSAIKKFDTAAFIMIENYIKDDFPGGKVIILDINNNSVGIPDLNPNLDLEVVEKVNIIIESMKKGVVKVPRLEDPEILFYYKHYLQQ